MSRRPSDRVIGRVTGGRGIASQNLGGAVADAIERQIGAPPVPGTLNIFFSRPIAFDPNKMVLAVDRRRYFWPAQIEGIFCLAYRWIKCPLHVLGLVSDCHLRTELALEDGARVTLEFPPDVIVSVPFRNWIAWLVMWGATGPLYYTSDVVNEWSKKFPRLRDYTVQKTSVD